MKAQNFKTAMALASAMQFDDFGFQEDILSHPTITVHNFTFGPYYLNWIGLYFDDDNGYFSIQLQEDGWHLCYDDVSFCKIGGELSAKLDEMRAWELGAEERERQAYRNGLEWRMELMNNYGPGML